MKKKKFKFPDFNKMSYKEEVEWWDKHDFTEFWDELDDVKVIVDLEKPKEETLVLRLQKDTKEKLEKVAKKKGINVSSLARLWLTQRLQSS
ncbi:hypothetical protein A3C59_00705 [Candidatus Daviesbacteria bacterium RIFCSPHIGHO2_02_FULL_36_13]|uniref:CopG antitoxin of type II toxin-antitoxin system n=1 Tax=Candidatus Daviesbacteria bacterium RIFCSPHIGHO2_02_FULL_36_13 TaxID=1797768 RepID=A0A1F5JZV4_9BACT|nr:MAG: hypothetical protein A3C59_00705 [Candidatus Daviesbacteria bacterium RIFCSPHIGHO2_02_FULL_36_13]OGE41575.1 MAG: hypothetical protein A3A45_03060 [Candidatus Daviesbacteria bacterium RIFCSPLOWO2_01_FULL_36_8]